MGAQLLRVGGLCTGEDARPLLPLATAAGKATPAPSPGERSREGWTPRTLSCYGGTAAPNPARGASLVLPIPGTPLPHAHQAAQLLHAHGEEPLIEPQRREHPHGVQLQPHFICGREDAVGAGMEKGPDPGWARGNCHHGTVAACVRWHPWESLLTSGRIHLHKDVLPVPAEPGGEGPQDVPHRGVDGQHGDQARVVRSVDLVGHCEGRKGL